MCIRDPEGGVARRRRRRLLAAPTGARGATRWPGRVEHRGPILVCETLDDAARLRSTVTDRIGDPRSAIRPARQTEARKLLHQPEDAFHSFDVPHDILGHGALPPEHARPERRTSHAKDV